MECGERVDDVVVIVSASVTREAQEFRFDGGRYGRAGWDADFAAIPRGDGGHRASEFVRDGSFGAEVDAVVFTHECGDAAFLPANEREWCWR